MNFNQSMLSRSAFSGNSDHSSQISEVTLVTAFFDIGSFQKGKYQVYTPSKYTEWMRAFKYIENPLYVYVDNEENADIFKDIRGERHRNRTKIIVLDRRKMWSFNLKENISHIFSNPKYPKFYPNTVLADYSCAMHAKYEVVKKSIETNAFNTKYFAWIDVGYFRDSLEKKNLDYFQIVQPPNFLPHKVAYNEVFNPSILTLRQIIYENKLWVGGGFFIAKSDVMLKWIEDYMYYTEQFIELNLISTDQQVIYGMIQPRIHKKIGKRRVAIQTYKGSDPSIWLYLGYLCKKPM